MDSDGHFGVLANLTEMITAKQVHTVRQAADTITNSAKSIEKRNAVGPAPLQLSGRRDQPPPLPPHVQVAMTMVGQGGQGPVLPVAIPIIVMANSLRSGTSLNTIVTTTIT
jgi:hypothetical protein